jgi:hypothetical protein
VSKDHADLIARADDYLNEPEVLRGSRTKALIRDLRDALVEENERAESNLRHWEAVSAERNELRAKPVLPEAAIRERLMAFGESYRRWFDAIYDDDALTAAINRFVSFLAEAKAHQPLEDETK